MSLRIMKIIITIIAVYMVSPLMKYHPDIREAVEVQTEESQPAVSETAETENIKEEKIFAVSEESEAPDETEPSEVRTESASAGKEGIQDHAEETKAESVTEPETETPATAEEIQYVETTEPIPETEAVVTTPETVAVIVEIETQPPHIHSWEEIIGTVHHDAEYRTIHHERITEKVWIEDQPAYDEVYENTYLIGIHDICKGCGMDITASGMSYEEYDAHDRQHILNGEDSSYYSEPIYQTVTETVHHEAQGHYEDQVAQEAYEETVLVSEAWDEQVVTGYRCCECGAQK